MIFLLPVVVSENGEFMSMRRLTRKEVVIFSIAICLLVLGTTGFFALHGSTLPHMPGANVQAQIAYWKSRIAQVGGKAAYQEFATSVADLSPNDQHTHAHEFGAALYKEAGLSGISVCDERFSQGCFHEFIGEAVIAHGFGIVHTLSEECASAIAPDSYFCQHGIGHGILALSGYDEASLKKALAQCPLLVTDDPLNGCYTGIFMEYYERDVLNGEDSPRPVGENDWFAPCNDLSGISQYLCFYSLPRWWHQLFVHQHETEEDALKQMSALCTKLQDKVFLDICFSGIGHVVPPSAGYDASRSIMFCNEASASPRYRLLCRAEAANDFLDEGNPANARSVCEGLTGASLAYCGAYSSITSEKSIQIPFPHLP